PRPSPPRSTHPTSASTSHEELARRPPPDPSARPARPPARLAGHRRLGPGPAPARRVHRQPERELPAPRPPAGPDRPGRRRPPPRGEGGGGGGAARAPGGEDVPAD